MYSIVNMENRKGFELSKLAKKQNKQDDTFWLMTYWATKKRL